MKSLRTGLLLVMIVAGQPGLSTPVEADAIEIGVREAENLGVSVIRPRRTDRAATLNAMARVVLPPQADMAVAALQSGVVTRLYASAGDQVSLGQPLADIASEAFLALQSDYLDALGMRALTETVHARDERLHAEGIVSLRRLNEARTRAAEADLHLAEQRHLLRLNGLGADELQQLETTRELIRSLTVQATMTGEVLKRWVGVGDEVNPGVPLFRIGDLSQLWLEIQLPAEALSNIAPGLVVTRNIPGTEQELARITVTTRVVEPGSQKVMVRAETTAPGHQLLPGQRVEVSIHIPEPAIGDPITWEVPARAITHYAAGAYLFARSATGFDVLPVTLHGGHGELAFVEAAIDERSRIALTGVAALKAIWLSAED